MARLIEVDTEEELAIIQNYLIDGRVLSTFTPQQKSNLKRKCSKLILNNYQLLAKSQSVDDQPKIFVCSFELARIQEILKREHENGHPGITKMEKLISSKYVGIKQSSIREFVSKCNACQNFNSIKTVENIRPIVCKYKGERYQMDCIDLRRYSVANNGVSWILTILDCYTKFLWAFPLKK